MRKLANLHLGQHLVRRHVDGPDVLRFLVHHIRLRSGACVSRRARNRYSRWRTGDGRTGDGTLSPSQVVKDCLLLLLGGADRATEPDHLVDDLLPFCPSKMLHLDSLGGVAQLAVLLEDDFVLVCRQTRGPSANRHSQEDD